MTSLAGSGNPSPPTYAVDSIKKAGIKLPFEGDLHLYQIEDINRGALSESFGAFLDLGLGKTVVSAMIGGFKLLNWADRCVVICPASLINQWTETLEAMNFAVLARVGKPDERKVMGFDYDFIVMSFEIFQKDYEQILSSISTGTYFIVDEATVLSNTNNKFYKMFNGGIIKKKRKVEGMLKPMIDIIEYPKVNKGCCLLTATPSNNPSDLYGLINSIDNTVYSNQFQFNRLHVTEENLFGVPTSFQNLDILKDKLNAVASIRFASDHLDLPDKVYNIIEYDLDPAHYELYEELVTNKMVTFGNKIVINAIEATSFYNWAQKIIVNPDQAMYNKDPKGLAILDTIVRNVPRILIINKYIMSNDKMMERYKDIGIGGCYGGISRPNQQKYITAFKEGRLRALTINPKSGGVGLNLQICNQAVYPEIPVTARDFRQSEGRIYRQGQEADRVIITILIARRTIQKTLLSRIMERDDIMSEVIPAKRLRDDLFPA